MASNSGGFFHELNSDERTIACYAHAYRMSAAGLDERFLASVKSLFGANEVEISICGPAQSEADETACLLKSEANRTLRDLMREQGASAAAIGYIRVRH